MLKQTRRGWLVERYLLLIFFNRYRNSDYTLRFSSLFISGLLCLWIPATVCRFWHTAGTDKKQNLPAQIIQQPEYQQIVSIYFVVVASRAQIFITDARSNNYILLNAENIITTQKMNIKSGRPIDKNLLWKKEKGTYRISSATLQDKRSAYSNTTEYWYLWRDRREKQNKEKITASDMKTKYYFFQNSKENLIKHFIHGLKEYGSPC